MKMKSLSLKVEGKIYASIKILQKIQNLAENFD